jgi:hypothetical protein
VDEYVYLGNIVIVVALALNMSTHMNSSTLACIVAKCKVPSSYPFCWVGSRLSRKTFGWFLVFLKIN